MKESHQQIPEMICKFIPYKFGKHFNHQKNLRKCKDTFLLFQGNKIFLVKGRNDAYSENQQSFQGYFDFTLSHLTYLGLNFSNPLMLGVTLSYVVPQISTQKFLIFKLSNELSSESWHSSPNLQNTDVYLKMFYKLSPSKIAL